MSENADYAEALTRQIRELGHRAGEGDPCDLAVILGVLDAFEEAVAEAVATLRQRGYRWNPIRRRPPRSRPPQRHGHRGS